MIHRARWYLLSSVIGRVLLAGRLNFRTNGYRNEHIGTPCTEVNMVWQTDVRNGRLRANTHVHSHICLSRFRPFLLLLLLLLFRRHTEASVSSFSLSLSFHFFHFPMRSCFLYFCLFVLLSTTVLFLADLLFSSPLSLLFSFFFLSLFFWSGYIDSRGIWPLLFWGFSRTRTARTPLISRRFLLQEGCFLCPSIHG